MTETKKQELPLAEKNRTIKVLIVDDDAEFASATRRNLELLSMQHFECRVVLRAADALAAVESFKPDIVLLDNDFDGEGAKVGVNVTLPEIAGRFRHMDGRVIILTGKADPHSADDVIAAGAWGIGNFLKKPIATADLANAIIVAHNRALARAKS